MKALYTTLSLCLALALVAFFGGWVVLDYHLHCTVCLRHAHVKEHRFLNFLVSRSERLDQPTGDYERIFGRPCRHVYYKAGLQTANLTQLTKLKEASPISYDDILRPRLQAIQATFDAAKRLADETLTLETFKIIDRLMPPQIRMSPESGLPEKSYEALVLLDLYLRRAKTLDQWRETLTAAQGQFADTSKLPQE